MLTVYRRYSPKCKYQSMSEKRCRCPLWVNGTIDGEADPAIAQNEGLGHRPEKSPRLGSSGVSPNNVNPQASILVPCRGNLSQRQAR
jgi:hypothetical protein